VRVHKRGVRLEAEAGIAEHILQRQLETADISIRPVHLAVDVEDCRLPGERIGYTWVGLGVDSANDDVAEVLVEAIDRRGGTRPIADTFKCVFSSRSPALKWNGMPAMSVVKFTFAKNESVFSSTSSTLFGSNPGAVLWPAASSAL